MIFQVYARPNISEQECIFFIQVTLFRGNRVYLEQSPVVLNHSIGSNSPSYDSPSRRLRCRFKGE